MSLLIKNIPIPLKYVVRREFCSHISGPGLFSEVSSVVKDTENKVTVVGAGHVGVACASAILTQGISNSLVLVDKEGDKLIGETLDLRHGSLFLKSNKIEASTSYKKTANSRVTIITAGIPRKTMEESRFSLAQRNIEIFREIIPEIVKYSPNTILLVVTNPVDIMTWVAWKLSRLPLNRVIGNGTNVDSTILRMFISRKFGIPASNCHAYVIGEHDQNMIAVWSVANIGGVRLRELNPKAAKEGDQEEWKKVERIVFESPQRILKLKGHTCWALALSVGQIVNNILSNENKIRTVTTNVKGYHGINSEVFLSLPCVLNANGVHKIVKYPLEKEERERFLETAKKHRKYMERLELYKS